MWTKRSHLLLVGLNLKGEAGHFFRRRWWLFLTLALYVPENLLLAWEGLFSLVPGQAGRWVRSAADTMHCVLLELMAAEPMCIANVDLTDGEQYLRAVVRTWGVFGGGDKA